MPRDLSELTLEELWELFPIILAPHNREYRDWYEHKAGELTSLLPITRISHIGSTAVPGLVAKPIVDILLETTMDRVEIIETLGSSGWILHSDSPQGLSFNQGYTPDGFAPKVFHLHVRTPGDHDELYFRDYLRDHREVHDDYVALKSELAVTYRNHRDNYTDAKGEFIRTHTEKARADYGPRYAL